MSKNNAQLRLQKNNVVSRKRMYKAKSHWNVMTTGAVALGALTLGVVANEGTTHADTVVPSVGSASTMTAPTTSAVVSAALVTSTATPTAPAVEPSTPQSQVATSVVAGSNAPATSYGVVTSEGSSVIQGPTTSTQMTTITPVVNSANIDVASAFSSQHNAIEDAGGTLNQTSTSVVNVNSQNASDQASFVKSDAASQLANINATASMDAALRSAAKAADATSLTAGNAIDVTSMTPDEIRSLGTAQFNLISGANSANVMLSNTVDFNNSLVASMGGSLVVGSAVDVSSMTPEQIQSMVSKAIEMVNVTGSADVAISNVVTSNASDIAKVGGELKKGSLINTADHMTVSDVESSVQSQVSNVSAVGAADRELLSDVTAGMSAVSNVGGKLMAGSTIDASSMTPEQIQSMLANQTAMISATVSADTRVSSLVSEQNSAVEKVGGKVVISGVVNTADNMTSAEIDSQIASHSVKVGEVLSADTVLSSAVSTAEPAISEFSGVVTPGSQMIDATNLSSDVIKSLVSKQVDMLMATSDADEQVSDALSENGSQIAKFGGTAKKIGTVNTADNMTVSQVLDNATKQAENIYYTGSADRLLSHAVKKNTSAVAALSGVLNPGSAIDVSSMSSAEIASLATAQRKMIHATAQADMIVSDAIDQYGDKISDFNGTITQSGTINTADNMTTHRVAKSAHSEVTNLSATASGDVELSNAVAVNKNAVESMSGALIAGSAINVSSMLPGQINKIVAAQSHMIKATADADTLTKSALDNYSNDIINFNGTVTHRGAINTADNMTVSGVASAAQKQAENLQVTGSADKLLSQGVANNIAAVSGANGQLIAGSAIDTTDMTPVQIASLASAQNVMISATGSADAELTSAVVQNENAIANFNGTLSRRGTINTADNMTASGVKTAADTETSNIVATGSGDVVLSQAVANNRAAVSSAGGQLVAGSSIDTSSMTPAQVASLVSNQQAMINATGKADSDLTSAVNGNRGNFTATGAALSQKGTINTADNMTASGVASVAASQNVKIVGVGYDDALIHSAQQSGNTASTPFGGSVNVGSSIDVTGMNLDQINSATASQVAKIGAVAQNNVSLSNLVGRMTAPITAIGGQLNKGSVINVTSMTTEQLNSLAAKQGAILSATGAGDIEISQAISMNNAKITGNGGMLTSKAAVNVAGETVEQINSRANSQAANIAATGNNDARVSAAVNDDKGAIISFGGTVTRSTPTDVTSMTTDAIASLAQHQIDNIKATHDADVVLGSAINQYQGSITSFGGTVQKGRAIDVTNKTTNEIGSIADSQAKTLSATASGDLALSTTVSENVDPISLVGGSINRGSDINTANMTVAQVDSVTQSQRVNIANTAAQDRVLSTAMDTYRNPIQLDGGRIHVGTSTDVSTWNLDQMKSLVQSQSVQMSDAAIANSNMQSAIDANSAVITGIGGAVKSVAAVDASKWSASQMNSLVNSQAQNMSQLAYGDQVLTSAVHTNSSAAVLGDANDVTGQSSEQIASYVGSQVVAIGQATDADRIADSQVQDLTTFNAKAHYVDVVASTAQDITSFASENVAAHSVAVSQAMWSNQMHNMASDYNNKLAADAQGLSVAWGNDYPVNTMQQLEQLYNEQSEEVHHAHQNGITTTITLHRLNVGTIPQVDAQMLHVRYLYHPLSMTYKALDITTTPLSTEYHVLSSVGGVTPLSTTYSPLSTTYYALSDQGGYTPQAMSTTPYSMTYENFSSDGSKIPVYNADGSLNKHFTGFTPLSTTYKNFSSDGSKVSVYNADGSLNKNFTGFTPLSTIYKSFSSDGSKISVYNKDGSLNKNFTGFTPLSTTYKNFSSDGSKVPVYNADGSLNKHFTGFTPMSTTYKNFSSDGVKVAVYNQDGSLNEGFTGYVPFEATYQGYESDGSKVKPGDKYTGYAAFSTTYSPYTMDESAVKDGNTGFAPYAMKYNPYSTTYHFYMDQKEQPATPDSSSTSSNTSSVTSSDTSSATSSVTSSTTSSVVSSSAASSSAASSSAASSSAASSSVASSSVASSAMSSATSSLDSRANSSVASSVTSGITISTGSPAASSSVSNSTVSNVPSNGFNSVMSSATSSAVSDTIGSVLSSATSSATSSVVNSVKNSVTPSVIGSIVNSSSAINSSAAVSGASQSAVASTVVNSVSPAGNVQANVGASSSIPTTIGGTGTVSPAAGTTVQAPAMISGGSVVAPTVVNTGAGQSGVSQASLPQTGASQNDLALLGLAAFGLSLSMTMVGLKRKY